MNSLLLVSAVALIKERKVFFQQRPSGKSMPFSWELPGGKIKKNETSEDALIREIYEELGIQINHGQLSPLCFVSHQYKYFNLLMIVYVCKKWRGKIIPKENQNIGFFNSNELSKIKLLDADKGLTNYLKNYIN